MNGSETNQSTSKLNTGTNDKHRIMYNNDMKKLTRNKDRKKEKRNRKEERKDELQKHEKLTSNIANKQNNKHNQIPMIINLDVLMFCLFKTIFFTYIFDIRIRIDNRT